MFDTILFDLDGTLTNPYIGITDSVMYALDKLGYKVPPREELKCFIGPPLTVSYQTFFGMDEATAREGVRLYREHYAKNGLFKNELIDGAQELLQTLKKMNRRVCLATSKPREFAEKILHHFGIYEYFDYIGAATMDGSVGTKAEVVSLVLRETGASPESCVLVGDRLHDIVGAHETGIKCIAVLCGFGSREEFREYGADYIAETLLDVAALV